MAKDLKAEILHTAGELFHHDGYNEVSMRAIAEAMGISVGNLTYHFKRKEELVEAVILEQHKNYRKTPPPETVEELDAFFRRVLKRQSENRYYFRYYTQLAQLCPKVCQIQLQVMADWRESLGRSFQLLAQAGLMEQELFSGQWEHLIAALRLLCIHDTDINSYDGHTMLWSILYPLLTESGREVFRTMEKGKWKFI